MNRIDCSWGAQACRTWAVCVALATPSVFGQSTPVSTDPMTEVRDASRTAWNALPDAEPARSDLGPLRVVRPGQFSQLPPVLEVESPDHLRAAGTQQGALYVRQRASDQIRVVAQADESGHWDIEGAQWSPDGRLLVARKTDDAAVPRILLRGPQFGPGKEREARYSRVGQPLPRHRLFIVNVGTGEALRVRHGDHDPYVQTIGWSQDGRELRLLRADRYLKRLQLLAADASNGRVRLLHTESQPVSVVGLNMLDGFIEPLRSQKIVSFLPDGSFIWTSDRTGYRHLYLYGPDGALRQALTPGRIEGWVDRVVDVDAAQRVVYAKTNGHAPDPYFERLVRIDLDTGGSTTIAEADHIASIKFSADRSKVWLATAGFPETRNVIEVPAAGGQAKTLWQADFEAARAKGWRAPEVTMVPAADGRTLLRAMVFAPSPLEPGKRYPVIQNIYGGPNTVWVPPSPINGRVAEMAELARAGFVAVMVDGRGTPARGRAFQNYGYGRFGQVEADDQIAALRNLAKTRPYMDLGRAGVMGGSWGGYFGLRTLLKAPHLYKAGVFAAGAFEPSTMRVSVEPFMGCGPLDCPAAYRAGSNLARVNRIQAPLLIMHGTADDDVPIEESLRLVEALRHAGKPHEFVALEGATHAMGEQPAVNAARIAFFKKHLAGP